MAAITLATIATVAATSGSAQEIDVENEQSEAVNSAINAEPVATTDPPQTEEASLADAAPKPEESSPAEGATPPAEVTAEEELADSSDPRLEENSEQLRQRRRDIEAYIQRVSDIEAADGPYADALSQQLLGLGDLFAEIGEHPAAVGAYKRAVHVSRINQGLNHPAQVPITTRLVRSYLAVGDVEEADNRMRYIYRIALSSLDIDDPGRADAMMEFADWNRRTYLANVGDAPYLRLLQMYDIYQNVLELVVSTDGIHGHASLAPLEGLMSTFYLLSLHNAERSNTHRALRSSAGEEGGSSHETRVAFLQQMAFKRGKQVLQRMDDIHRNNPESEPWQAAEVAVARGDWLLWYGKQAGAREAYIQAWNELGELENGAELQKKYLGKPVPLPQVVSMQNELERPRRKKDDEEESGWARIASTVSERGRIIESEVLESEPQEKTAKLTRTLRNLRSKRYRPAFQDGEPIATQMVKRYDF